MNKVFLLGILIVTCFACKTESTKDNSLSKVMSDPTEANLKSYFSEVDKMISDNRDNKPMILSKLPDAIKVATENKQLSKASGYILSMLRLDKQKESRQPYVAQLANMLNEMNQTHAAKVLVKSYDASYGTDDKISGLADLLDAEIENLDTFMVNRTDAMFANPDQFGLNKQKAQEFVDIAEAYALANPNDPKAAAHLYKAAETARSIRTLPKALSIYDWIMEDYPNYEKTPTVLFLKGFVIENELSNDEEAKKIYESFLAKYPNHEMAQSVKFLLENLGKSDEEILKIIEEKGKQNQPAG